MVGNKIETPPVEWRFQGSTFPSGLTHLLPLVDVEAVVLEFLLEDFRDVDVHVHRLLLALPLDVDVRLHPLEHAQKQTDRRPTERRQTAAAGERSEFGATILTILLMSSEKALSPLFEDSGSESSPSLLSEDDIKPTCKERRKKGGQRSIEILEAADDGGGRRRGVGGGLTSVITVIFLRQSLQGRFSTRLTTTPLCPSLSLPVGRAQNTP